MGLGIEQGDDKQFEENEGENNITMESRTEAALVVVSGQTQVQNPLLAMHDRPFKNITVQRFDANPADSHTRYLSFLVPSYADA